MCTYGKENGETVKEYRINVPRAREAFKGSPTLIREFGWKPLLGMQLKLKVLAVLV